MPEIQPFTYYKRIAHFDSLSYLEPRTACNRPKTSLTLWRPLLSYGYSCKASSARPG